MHYTVNKSRFKIEGHGRDAGFTDLMKWQLGGGRAKWPRRIENQVHPPPPQRVSGTELSVTWVGHSTVLIQTAGLNVLTDPFFSQRASPLQVAGPKRVRDPGLRLAQLPPIDVVLLSHNHYDHLDVPSLRELQKHSAPHVVTPLMNDHYVRRASRKMRVTDLHWRDSVMVGECRITVMPALHWSKRSFGDANRALWGAFVAETPGGVIYFAGDTGYGDGSTFREVQNTFGAPRLSLLPIGAYEPRWFMKSQHMNPDDAVQAHLDLGSSMSLAIHHGTIQLTNEAIDAPVRDLRAALLERGVDPETFAVADIGQTIGMG